MSGDSQYKRGDVFWVNLDPTQGTETKKTRPAVLLSNNLFNKYLPRVIVAPITSNVSKIFEFEAFVSVAGKEGKVMLDQTRSVDKGRLGKKICSLTEEEIRAIEIALKLALELN
jgi:mRNA interferase MazF